MYNNLQNNGKKNAFSGFFWTIYLNFQALKNLLILSVKCNKKQVFSFKAKNYT